MSGKSLALRALVQGDYKHRSKEPRRIQSFITSFSGLVSPLQLREFNLGDRNMVYSHGHLHD